MHPGFAEGLHALTTSGQLDSQASPRQADRFGLIHLATAAIATRFDGLRRISGLDLVPGQARLQFNITRDRVSSSRVLINDGEAPEFPLPHDAGLCGMGARGSPATTRKNSLRCGSRLTQICEGMMGQNLRSQASSYGLSIFAVTRRRPDFARDCPPRPVTGDRLRIHGGTRNIRGTKNVSASEDQHRMPIPV